MSRITRPAESDKVGHIDQLEENPEALVMDDVAVGHSAAVVVPEAWEAAELPMKLMVVLLQDGERLVADSEMTMWQGLQWLGLPVISPASSVSPPYAVHFTVQLDDAVSEKRRKRGSYRVRS